MCAPSGGPGQRIAPGSSGTCGTTPGMEDLAELRVLDVPHHAALAELRVGRDSAAV